MLVHLRVVQESRVSEPLDESLHLVDLSKQTFEDGVSVAILAPVIHVNEA